MISIHVPKGYDLNIAGKPALDLKAVTVPGRVGVLPSRIPFIKPRLLVKKGDQVRLGTPLFEDKRNPLFKFLSPGGGRVIAVDFGPRRTLLQIVIQLEQPEAAVAFEPIAEAEIESAPRQTIIQKLLDGGLWPLIRALPFRNIADPETTPPAIWVPLGGREPFQPAASVYLKDKLDLFAFGLKLLRRLAPEVHVYANVDDGDDRIAGMLGELITHRVTGAYPAEDPGVMVYHTRRAADDNPAWYIRGQDVLLWAHLIRQGEYPTQRIVTLGGPLALAPGHIETRLGAPLDLIAGQPPGQSPRFVTGGLFRGASATKDTYLGFYDTSVLLLAPEAQDELFGFLRPGFDKPTYSRTFLSRLNPGALHVDPGMHGEQRACINCGTCAKVCPVAILPQFTFKAVHADDVEEALSHGLLDCVECGLCSFVCPSKIELTGHLKSAKLAYRKERG